MPSDLIVNPRFWLEPRWTGGEIVRAVVMAPVKGRGLQFFYLDRKEHGQLFRLVIEREVEFRAMTPKDVVLLPSGQKESLFAIGALIREEEIPGEVSFQCFLNDATLEWLPIRYRKEFLVLSETKELIVNPTFVFQNGDRLPDSMTHLVRCPRHFLKGFPLAWIENPGSGLRTPYWVEPHEAVSVASFKAGERPPASLGFGFRAILEMARILVPPEYPDECRKVWQSWIEKGRQHFVSRDHAVLPDLLPPLQIAALRRYGRALVAEGYTTNGDSQVVLRQARQHEEVVGFFHRQLATLVSRIAGQPLKPSINFFYAYHSRADLEPHVDIDEDRYGISLLLDYEPELEDVSPWPLCLEGPDKKEIRISQEIGNAVFYDGCKLPHYRGALPEGQKSASLLFHFVPDDFCVRSGWI